MAIILNIDTAVDSASICLANNDTIIEEQINPVEREAGTWLHTAINALVKKNNLTLQQLEAVAVTSGPGSYTGLRVGMAAAKGLCYALSIPLINLSTLQVIAASIIHPQTDLLCPMIDARRMEVFFCLYNQQLDNIIEPGNVILEAGWLHDELVKHSISFFGNGSMKASNLIKHPHAFFITSRHSARNMISLSARKYELNQFSDLAYAEPFYGKAFYSTISKKIY